MRRRPCASSTKDRSAKEDAWFDAAYEGDLDTLVALWGDSEAPPIQKRGVAPHYQRHHYTYNGRGEQFTRFYYHTYFADEVTDATEYYGRNAYSRETLGPRRRGYTALEYAAMMGNRDVIEMLLSLIIDVNNEVPDIRRIQHQYPDGADLIQEVYESMP